MDEEHRDACNHLSPPDDDGPDIVLRNEDIQFTYHLNSLERQVYDERTELVFDNPADLVKEFQQSIQKLTEHISKTSQSWSESSQRMSEKACDGMDSVIGAYLGSIDQFSSKIQSATRMWDEYANKHRPLILSRVEPKKEEMLFSSDPEGRLYPASKRIKVAESETNESEEPRVMSLHTYQQRLRIPAPPATSTASNSFDGWGQSSQTQSQIGSSSSGWGSSSSSSARWEASSTPSNGSLELIASTESILVTFEESPSALVPDTKRVRSFFEKFGSIRELSFISQVEASISYWSKMDAQAALSQYAANPLMWDGTGRIDRIVPVEAPSQRQSSQQNKFSRIKPGDPRWMEIMNWVNEGVVGHGVAASARKFRCGEGLIRRILDHKKRQLSQQGK